MASFSEISHKKVLGVPVLYLAAGAVVILAVVAWRMKATPDAEVTPEDTPTEGDDTTSPGGAYEGLATTGTVVAQSPNPVVADPADPIVKTNEDWVREGAEWLTAQNKASGSVAAAALNKYVGGLDRSYDEQALVDAVLKEKGQPPDTIAEGGKTGYKPAVKQITKLPGVHVVKGGADNTFGDIALIYYGHNEQATYDLVQAANIGKIGGTGPFAVGTSIFVPAYSTPKYYVTPSTMTAAQVASKNGISVDQLHALTNENKTNYPKGAKLRVK